MRFDHPQSDVLLSLRYFRAKSRVTNEEEHAVSIVIEGPERSKR